MSGERDLRDRLPPQSTEAERAVLGSLLRDNLVISDIQTFLHKDDFYADAHQKIYDAIISLHDQGGKPVDLITLAEALKQSGSLEDVGGYGYLGGLWDAAPTAANAEYYAHIVRDKAQIRNLIHASTEILGEAYSQTTPAEQLVGDAERKILEIAERGISNHLYTLDEAMKATYDRIDRRTTGDGMSSSGVSTGFTDLDELTAGLHDSELVIIAARPSVGKTSFALNLVRHIIVNEKLPVFFVSLEQSRIELAERLLCSQARVDSQRLRKGALTAEDMEKLIEAGSTLREGQLFIDDSPSQGMLRISANARRLKRRRDIRLVVLDYLQLIEPENRRDPRHEQVAQVSRRLKTLAKELEVPVIALAQVNRASEDRQDHRPRVSDLRESGSIEQDADTILLLHRPDRYEPGQHEGVIEVIVGKQRSGPVGEITLAYRKQYMLYEDFKVGTPFDG
jgi:replicative DNA helicase